jgi:elongation factor P
LISVNDLRNGITLDLEGNLWTVIEFMHVKPGKGAAFVRAKLRNIRTGAVVEQKFNAGERVARAHLDYRDMQFLYESDGEYTFMDTETYEQVGITRELLGDQAKFLKENMEVSISFYESVALGVELPNSVVLEVVETDPGLKGDTASGGSKPATLQGGAVVQVPLFINIGDKLSIDTRTGQYLSRA